MAIIKDVFFISKSDKLFPHFQDHSTACVRYELEDRLSLEKMLIQQSLQAHTKIQTHV